MINPPALIGTPTRQSDFVWGEQPAGLPMGLVAIAIANAGGGYTNGDTLTLAGGIGTYATLTVTSTGGGGAITLATIATAGSYLSLPDSYTGVAVTGGTGANATFNIRFSALPPVPDLITLDLDQNLRNRRLWGYMAVTQATAGDWFVQARLKFPLGGSEVGELPLSQGNCTPGSSSYQGLGTLAFVGGGSSSPTVAGGLYVSINNPPQGNSGNWYLIPFDLPISASALQASILSSSNVTSVRVFLAVLSWQ